MQGPGRHECKDVKEMNGATLFETASQLFDGGWRADDREYLAEYYELTKDEADEIAEVLAEFEQEA